MVKIALPEGLIKLNKLLNQYPNWDKGPEDVADKVVSLALSNGGFGWFQEGRFLNYILELTVKAARREDEDKTIRRLRSYAKLIFDCYSPGLLSKKLTEKRLLEIYIKVEEFREKHGSTKTIIDATRAVAREIYNIHKEIEQMNEKERRDLTKKLGYVHKKYYEIKGKLEGISLEEVKIQYEAAKGSSKYVSKPHRNQDYIFKNIGHRDFRNRKVDY